MALTAKRLSGPTQLTATAVTQYTAPASTTTRVTEILLANTTATDRTVTIHCVPSAGTAGATNQIVPAVNVPANTMVRIPLGLVLGAGDFIAALAAAATAVNMTMSGTEIT